MTGKWKRIGSFAGLLLTGAAGYGLLEILWRGYTHISMLVTGGICFCYLVELSKTGHNLLRQCVEGAAGITIAELAIGCVVNLWLGLEVWDYSEEALHLWGQICPRFFLLWCALCALLLPACRCLRKLPPVCKQLFFPRKAGID